MEKKQKILVAMDASAHSLEAVQYVGDFFSPQHTEIELFHVDTHIPESFWDMNLGPGFQQRITSVKSWTLEHEKVMKNQMETARVILIELGFPYKSITLKYHDAVKGVARDIIEETKNDFHAVVVGRTGISRIKDFIIGSIPTKLVGKILGMPLIIVGACTIPKKVMLAFDGSESAQRAVDCLCQMMKKEASIVKICYVIRTISDIYKATTHDMQVVEDEMFKQTRSIMEPMIEEAVERLVSADFKRENISHEIKQNEYSRAMAVVEDAEKNGFGTIVVGRRGLSRVEEFFIGRVSKKILQLAANSTVWIVN